MSTSSFPLSIQAPDRSRWMTVSVTRAQRVLLQGCTNDATTLRQCALWLLRSTLRKTSVNTLQVFPEVSLQKTFIAVKPAGQRAHILVLKTLGSSAETVPIYTLSNQSTIVSAPHLLPHRLLPRWVKTSIALLLVSILYLFSQGTRSPVLSCKSCSCFQCLICLLLPYIHRILYKL